MFVDPAELLVQQIISCEDQEREREKMEDKKRDQRFE